MYKNDFVVITIVVVFVVVIVVVIVIVVEVVILIIIIIRQEDSIPYRSESRGWHKQKENLRRRKYMKKKIYI